jgi:hypothetical protein
MNAEKSSSVTQRTVLLRQSLPWSMSLSSEYVHVWSHSEMCLKWQTEGTDIYRSRRVLSLQMSVLEGKLRIPTTLFVYWSPVLKVIRQQHGSITGCATRESSNWSYGTLMEEVNLFKVHCIYLWNYCNENLLYCNCMLTQK